MCVKPGTLCTAFSHIVHNPGQMLDCHFLQEDIITVDLCWQLFVYLVL